MNKENKILIPFNFSEESLIVLEQSYEIAQMLNAEIYLLYVINKNILLDSIIKKKTILKKK